MFSMVIFATSKELPHNIATINNAALANHICLLLYFIFIHSLSAKGTEGVMKRCAIAIRRSLLYCICRASTLQNPWR